MEAKVWNEWKLVPRRRNKLLINGTKDPIQDGNKNVQRRCTYREFVLQCKRCSLREMSARRPNLNVIVDIVSAMMVRNGYEPPNPLCRGLIMLGIHENEAAKNRSPATCMRAEMLLDLCEEVGLCRVCVVIISLTVLD